MNFSKWYTPEEMDRAIKDLSAIFKFVESYGMKNNNSNKEGCICKNKETNNLKDIFNNYCTKCNDSSYKGFEMKNICNDAGNCIGVELTYLVPGVEKENIGASIDGQTVIVSSNKVVPYFGKLEHKVKMKFEIDKANTKLENGVLKISLYKKKEEEPIKLKIM